MTALGILIFGIYVIIEVYKLKKHTKELEKEFKLKIEELKNTKKEDDYFVSIVKRG